MRVIKNLFISLDQAINCLVKLSDGFGQPDEMFSARAYRLRESNPKIYPFIDKIFFWDDDHCRECYFIEMERKQLPNEYRRHE